jgi:hypothetical protein
MVLLASVVVAPGCSGLNAQTNSFATLAEARQAGAIAQGWIPDGLPPGTHDIRLAYVPDGPQRWGIVNFPPAEGDTLKALLADEMSLQGIDCDVPPRIEWWPIVLRGALDEEQIRATGLRAHRARQRNLVFAVNWNQGRAYYWTIP